MLLNHFLLLLEKTEWDPNYSDEVINGLLELCVHDKLGERVIEEFEYNRRMELMTRLEIEFWDKLSRKLNVQLKTLEDYKSCGLY